MLKQFTPGVTNGFSALGQTEGTCISVPDVTFGSFWFAFSWLA